MIIGITGTNGAGKGTVVEYLKKKGFGHYSSSEFVVEEARRRGLPLDRDSLHLVGTELRRNNHPAFITQGLCDRARAAGGDAVIESIRSIPASVFIKSYGGILFSVDANRRVRYERVLLRGTEKDKVSFERFCEQEDRELHPVEPNAMDIAGAMSTADAVLHNDGTREELYAQIDAALTRLTN